MIQSSGKNSRAEAGNPAGHGGPEGAGEASVWLPEGMPVAATFNWKAPVKNDARNVNPFPIIDGHNDTLLSLHEVSRGGGRSFFVRDERGHIDLIRAREGGFAGGFFAVFTPSPTGEGAPEPTEWVSPSTDLTHKMAAAVDPSYARDYVLAMVARLLKLQADSDGALKVVRNAHEMADCLRRGVLGVVLHVEGAEAIDDDLNMLYVLYEAGLRSIGPVWSRPNAFGHGVPFAFPHSPDTGPGLTDTGRRLIKACNQLGVMLDLSHLNFKGFMELAELSNAPLVATHSGAHAICPSPRNLTDDQLRLIAGTDGLVGVVFHTAFIRPDGKSDPQTPLSAIVEHVRHIADTIGVRHLALGSDFDGCTTPSELSDVTGLPRMLAALRTGGFTDDELKQITHRNWLRVMYKTWNPAR